MKIISIVMQMTEAETAEWETAYGRSRIQHRAAASLRPVMWPPVYKPGERLATRAVEVELLPHDGIDALDTFEVTPAGDVRRCALPEELP